MSEVNSNSATAIDELAATIIHASAENLDICPSFHIPKNEKLAVA